MKILFGSQPRNIRVLLGLIGLLSLAPGVHATFFDVDGEVTGCDGFACDLAGIAIGNQIGGFLEVRDDASGPNSTFTGDDILLGEVSVGDLGSGVVEGPFANTELTTDAFGEIVAGTGQISTLVDVPFGPAEVVIVLDASSGTWVATTTYLGLGEVSNGTLTFSRRVDTDGDGVFDSMDNCTLVANPTQLDSNGDGFGNMCDPDLDNNGTVAFTDYVALTAAFLSVPGDTNWNPDADLNGDSAIGFPDLALFPPYFLGVPGPSGVAP